MCIPCGRRTLSTLLAAGLVAGCASRPARDEAPEPERNVITREQLVEHNFNTAFDAVQALRSNWLRKRGEDSFRSPTQIWVYVDDVRMGGIESLRSIPRTGIEFIRYYDALTASARWGLDHGQGVIYVSTRPRRPP